ncbi:phospholipase SGR2-like isoform X3 [Salvia splendens]|uniref:phospholipase SGR2-like isoform X3 n=1 Tax=Salvia splendens TaxID=180675 RepID=UPI001C2723C7|nr:phospholipase SGR2-like isoform X3 [Salvia splendens]
MKSDATAAGGEVNEPSPDMLTNTPLNIMRLSSEIEQCEGRQKYLARTTSPSDGGDVRWYFCKAPLAPNELAASVPQTEIVGKGDYFRFGMRDSLAIEASFLQREDELLSSWWKECAESSAGPIQTSFVSKSPLHINRTLPGTPQSNQLYSTDEERVGVPVKGGLYEVDLVRRHCFPVYWNGHNRRVLRGHWFACKGGQDWLPLREDVSEQLEYAYRNQVWRRRTFQLSGLYAARVDIQGPTPGLHALFTGEDDTWKAWLGVDVSRISGVVKFGKNGINIRRGYAPPQSQKPTKDELRQQQEEEMDDYCSQVPVGHLVFMVHGIGQRLEKSNLVDDVGDFRLITASVAERHLTFHQLATQRILYIPCQWRKGLTLSGEVAVEKITLDGVRGLRRMLSATVHDVLYYMSPIYCQEIIDSVSNQLNKLYLKFLKRNPGYDGKVSIYGHSLGSVLSYDILCHQETLTSPFPMEWMYKEKNKNNIPHSVRNNLTSNNSSNSNSRCESSESVLSENMVGPLHYPDLVEDPTEGTSNPLGPPISSESDLSSLGGNADELFHGLYDMDFNKNDLINEPDTMRTDAVVFGDSTENFDRCKADKIRLLMEEKDLLKAKVKEFEADCYSKVNAKKSSSDVNQSDLKRRQHGHRDSLKSYTPQIRYTKLEFKVDTFFAVGSPLGVFLSLRNVRIGIGKGKEYWKEKNINEEMPACRQMFNIFHPFDPVAYRIEPLVCEEIMHKPPVIIPYHRGGKRLYVVLKEFKEGLASCSQAVRNHFSRVRVKVLTLCESRSDDEDEQSASSHKKNERSYGMIMMNRLTGSRDGRVDHVLQDKTFRHPYVSTIAAHTNYWRDYDTALFMLRHLYRDVAEEPNLSSEELEGSWRSRLKGWSKQREILDEELPLTFADNVFIKHFSYQVKKMSKKH